MYTRVCTIEDSVLKEVAYDIEAKKMRVTFATTDSVWEYENVYAGEFADIIGAHSPGRAFNAYIRRSKNAKRISPLPSKEIVHKQNAHNAHEAATFDARGVF